MNKILTALLLLSTGIFAKTVVCTGVKTVACDHEKCMERDLIKFQITLTEKKCTIFMGGKKIDCMGLMYELPDANLIIKNALIMSFDKKTPMVTIYNFLGSYEEKYYGICEEKEGI